MKITYGLLLAAFLIFSHPMQAADIFALEGVYANSEKIEKLYSVDEAPILSRLRIIANGRISLIIHGEIVTGDYEKLLKLYEFPVPVEKLFIRSQGGSVRDALKISRLVYDRHTAVVSDYEFECKADGATVLHELPGCGCYSACALIWLAAPTRNGSYVRIHRPYFDREYFSNLPDEVALSQYNESLKEVRSLLITRGYSEAFVAQMLNTPAETSRALNRDETEGLPIDYGLDQLTSARCIVDDAVKLSQYYQYKDEEDLAFKAYRSAEGQDFDAARQRYELARSKTQSVRDVYDAFLRCKEEERVAIIGRETETYITPEAREDARRLLNLLLLNALFASVSEHNDPEIFFKTEEISQLYNRLLSQLPEATVGFLTQVRADNQ